MKDRIKELRIRRSMTQQNLADELGLSRSTVAGYEAGNSVPDVWTLVRIAQILDTTTAYLTGEYDEPDFAVNITNEDPQLLQLKEILKGMSAQGIQKVVEYADVLAASGRYPKKPLRLNR